MGVFDDEFWFLREREGERERKRKKRYPHIFLPFISNHQAAIVTCGGLCPGLNDVVQSLTQKLAGGYGVKNIVGVRYGLKGFYDKTRKSVKLTPAAVEGIQLQGGTILGTSRGGADIAKIVQAISRQAIDMVFVVGGNGTYRCCCGSRRRNYVSLSHAQTTTTTDNDRHDRHDDSQAATRARRPSSRRARRTTCCAPWWAFRSRSTTIFC